MYIGLGIHGLEQWLTSITIFCQVRSNTGCCRGMVTVLGERMRMLVMGVETWLADLSRCRPMAVCGAGTPHLSDAGLGGLVVEEVITAE